ncbi:hypothetical protein AB4Z10_15695 [Bosea sp. RAF48]|uniref:hypothetical protein n=1 Tax=Bosea sp. RAF48 TaxID=3237480 RepID=UPI003F922536
MKTTINSQSEYEAALARIEELTGALEGTPEERLSSRSSWMSKYGGQSTARNPL